MLKKALSMREKLLGAENLAYAESFYHMARLYYDQGKYTKAESLYLASIEYPGAVTWARSILM